MRNNMVDYCALNTYFCDKVCSDSQLRRVLQVHLPCKSDSFEIVHC